MHRSQLKSLLLCVSNLIFGREKGIFNVVVAGNERYRILIRSIFRKIIRTFLFINVKTMSEN